MSNVEARLSIDITEESGDDDSDGSEYQPNFNMSLGPMEISGIEDCPGIGSVLPEENAEDDSDETIVADDRLSIVLRPTMLLIDFKIQVADIANRKKNSGSWLVLVQI